MDENLDNLPENTQEGEMSENLSPDGSDVEPSDRVTKISGMYEDWFLDYASYVILERAVPEILDGLKPVQRRILHAMKELDDGRYNKVANIIGHTMKYHPHGDAAIGDALVQLGQKDILIDTQGNWGNILTGDSSAAPRYIEARLSKFALDVVFNPKTTSWKNSYDGRNKEPLTLPVKFPLLLAQGVEGIAVGLASKIMPHNFNELIDASISYLKGGKVEIYPDFLTGGQADFSKYNDGLRGGKVRVRAKISILDKKTLVISEIPFATTTVSLIDSIVNANDKGKIKIKKIEDNTAQNVEIIVHLAPNISPDQAIDALYAFTDCEVSISPNCCVIEGSKPRFVGVSEILAISADHTVELLKKELEIEKHELLEQLLFSSLEKIFIENRIYRDIEECETWEAVIETIDKGLEPYKKQFYREITHDDIVHLTEIKIKRISKYDTLKADEIIRNLEEKLKRVNKNLENLIGFAIAYYKRIKEKYGKGRERKTEIRSFENIEATRVAVANEKLYVNRTEGFAGISLKKDEFVCDCSDIDDIIVFRGDGTFVVTKVSEKSFVGKDIIHIAVFEKNDDRTIYNMIYQDGTKGPVYMKRFFVKGVTRDKEYGLTKGTKGTKVLYFTANPNGEAEIVTVYLRHKPKLKKPVFDLDFKDLAIKGRSASGNQLTKHQVRKVVLKDQGVSTLSALNIWFDENVLRLNVDKRGEFIGAFKGDDKILSIFQSGNFRTTGYELSLHFENLPLLIEKYNPERIVSVVYLDGESGHYYIKRFHPELSEKFQSLIGEHPANRLIAINVSKYPRLKINLLPEGRKQKTDEIIDVHDFIGIKSYRAKGKRLTTNKVESMEWLEPEIPDEPETSAEPEETKETLEQEENEDILVETEAAPTETEAAPTETEDTSAETEDISTEKKVISKDKKLKKKKEKKEKKEKPKSGKGDAEAGQIRIDFE
ncbi:MAG: DNA gyrase/topoisomerase IV subunit A [Bacteroidetes bacterium]|nr:MAG: DNA gyrase/topoisomerase IV subunit A [Bacteroidota bacterium]